MRFLIRLSYWSPNRSVRLKSVSVSTSNAVMQEGNVVRSIPTRLKRFQAIVVVKVLVIFCYQVIQALKKCGMHVVRCLYIV